MMNHFFALPLSRHWAAVFALGLACVFRAQAQPYIVSVVPADGASGVSPSTTVVFTFNEIMDTGLTTAEFYDSSTFALIPTSQSWDFTATVLTCTPQPSFPASKMILWIVDGESLIGDPLESEVGSFTTGSGGGGSGTGTNAITTFSVGKLHFYNQSSSGTPTLDPDVPYVFTASTTLASNRTANSVALTLPTAAVSNLAQVFGHPETFSLFASSTNLSTFNSTFPAGNYVFNVSASASNQQVTVNLSAGLTQPAAPHVSNFAAAQSVNATQAFQLSWDAFPGGTTADFISVTVGNTFRSPDQSAPGALNGTSTSIVIPAGTLSAGASYDASVTFYRYTSTSNAGYTTTAYLATVTDFTLMTSGTGPTPLVFRNPGRASDTFSFDVASAAGETFVVEFSSTLLPGQWQLLATTNSATGLAHFTHTTANPYLFYRARKP